MKCVNEKCGKDLSNRSNYVWWGCDGDACCDQHCYNEARRQMDHFCRVTLKDDRAFSDWLGVDISNYQVK